VQRNGDLMSTSDIQLAFLKATCSRTNVIVISELKEANLETLAMKIRSCEYLDFLFHLSVQRGKRFAESFRKLFKMTAPYGISVHFLLHLFHDFTQRDTLRKIPNDTGVLVGDTAKVIHDTHAPSLFSKAVHLLSNLKAFDAANDVRFFVGHIKVSRGISGLAVVSYRGEQSMNR
jgi:hypothetical protein